MEILESILKLYLSKMRPSVTGNICVVIKLLLKYCGGVFDSKLVNYQTITITIIDYNIKRLDATVVMI